jgi:hypothetical protein
MTQFTSLAGLIQQSFSYLTASQASQLATVLDNTFVGNQNFTYGDLFANTMTLSAHVDGAANIYYSSNITNADGSTTYAGELAQ